MTAVSRSAFALVRARRGNFATMTALLAPVALGLLAVAVDAGSLYVEKQQAQSLTDLAAITAAANIGKASTAALRTFSDNHVGATLVPALPTAAGPAVIAVFPGRYEPQAGVSADDRFVPGAVPANAVRVSYARTGARHFASTLIPPPLITVTAVASQTPEAAFSVGARLASLNGGIANAVLGALLGSSVSLSVMDYNALLAADVSLFPFLDQLAIEIGASASTYDDLLASDVSIAQMARALSKTPDVGGAAKSFAQGIAAGARSGSTTTPLANVVSLGGAGHRGVGSAGGGFSATVGLLKMLSASAAVANGSRQLEIGLGFAAPGLLGVTLDLASGEPPIASPWLVFGEKGATVRTAQTRILATIQIGGPGGLVGTSVKLPIYIELASAEATLESVSCPTGRPESAQAKISAKPGVADLRIASTSPSVMDDFTKAPVFGPATLVKAPLVTIKGQARVAIASVSPKTVTFDATEIAAHAVKTVSTTDAVASIAASLIDDLDLDISVAGLDLGVSGVASAALSATLEPLAPAIDGVIFSILSALGVKIGEADIRINGLDCGRPVLVQ